MIHVKNVSKAFDGTLALNNLSMYVPRGAVYGLVGPNGAGKSTVIRHLAGIYKQDSGEVLADGVSVYENPLLKGRIAYIPDDLYFFPQASIRDMMNFYKGIYKRFDTERYFRLREAFKLDERRPMRRLSKGMQKQAAFWLAISSMPDILILDEPVDGLDPVMRRQVWSIVLADVTERGTTVLVSSHNLRELEDVCDHVGIMNAGALLLERALSELQEGAVKIQIAMRDGEKLPHELNVIHQSGAGKLQTLIIRGGVDEITQLLSRTQPLFMDALPLTLEEIFIYELGGEDYAVRDIIL